MKFEVVKDLINLNVKIVELSALSKNTRECVMLVHQIDYENANGLTFTLNSTEKYRDTLVNKPLVVKMNSTESDFKGHEAVFDETGNLVKLDTIPIGTITDTWIEDKQFSENEETVLRKCLMAKATIWSYKFPTAIEIMENLFVDGNLDTSVEVAIYSYTEDSEPSHRKTDEIEYLANTLLGSTILPADSNAGVVEMFWKEVAEVLNSNKPDESLSSLDTNSPVPNGGVVMLSHDEIKSQLNALLNPKDNSEGGWKVDYYSWDMVVYDGYCIARNADSGKLYRFDYQIENETSVTMMGEPMEHMIMYVPVPEGEEVAISEYVGKVKEMEEKVKELSTTLTDKETELSEALNTKDEELNQLKTELETLKSELNTKDEALKMNEVEANEKIIKLGEKVDELLTKISELDPIREEYEKVQKELLEKELAEKREVLKKFALNSKRISEQELIENVEIAQAIEELNEIKIKAIIADRVVAEFKPEVNTKPEDIVVNATEPTDLLPRSAREEMYAPKQKN